MAEYTGGGSGAYVDPEQYTGTPDERLHAKILACFKAALEAETQQREQELADLRFAAGDQWPDDLKRDRAGVNSGDGRPSTPPRPCLTINKLKQPVQQGVNQMRNAHLALKFAPKGSGASRETAEVLTDIARAIQVDSRAGIAREWAYARSYRCGRGCYRILTEYANDGDFDLDIVYKRILNQASVYLDPFAQEPDWSDGEWAFIIEDVPFDRYKREYGKAKSKLANCTDEELTGIGDQRPGWISGEGEKKAVRVAEYFYVIHEDIELQGYETETGEVALGPDDDVPEGAKKTERKRTRRERRVKWCKVNAVEILEQNDWPGRYIPIVPVIGEEENINGKRMWEGIVRAATDAQRSYNYMRSAQVESVGLAPRAPWLIAEGQTEGYEAYWQSANTRNWPYLPYKPKTLGGEMLPPPQRNAVEPAIQAVTLAVHEADGDIKAVTGFFDPSLGNLSAGERSGKAILALQKQQEQGGSGYLQNLTQISMALEGKILLDLIPKVYDRPGRVIAVMGEDDTRKSVMVNAPFVAQPSGIPQQVPEGTVGAKRYNLAEGVYSVAVSVGKSFTTKREEGAAAMGEIIASVPNIFPVVGDLYVGNLDFPGAKQMADRLKKTLPPQLQESEQSPEMQLMQLQQQAAQAQQLIDLMAKELKEKTRIIETDTIKAQQDLAIKELEVNSRERIEAEKIRADLTKTAATIQSDQAMAALQQQYQELSQQIEFMQSAWLAEQDRAFQASQAGSAQAHEAGMQGAEQGFQASQGAADRSHEQDMAVTQAALAPPKEAGG